MGVGRLRLPKIGNHLDHATILEIFFFEAGVGNAGPRQDVEGVNDTAFRKVLSQREG